MDTSPLPSCGELSITLLSISLKSHTNQILSAIMRPLISTSEVPAYHLLCIIVGNYGRSRQRTPNIVYTQVDCFQWVITSSHMRPIKSHFSHFISWLEITCEMWRVHSEAKSLASIFIARAVSRCLQKVIPLSAT